MKRLSLAGAALAVAVFAVACSNDTTAPVSQNRSPSIARTVIITPCTFTTSVSTYALDADCETDVTISVPSGFTLDGGNHTITAVDPTGGHFLGAVIGNAAGATNASVTNVRVTASGLSDVCDAGGDRLRGIMLDGASGSITNSHVTGVRQGLSGCQEGNAIEVRNFDINGNPAATQVIVDIAGNTVANFQKNGITTSGNVAATITNNMVTGDGPISYIGQNGIQVSYGATAKLIGNTAQDNNYLPKSYVACGLIIYKAGGVSASKSGLKYLTQENIFVNNEDNVCNFGKGGGYSPVSN